MMTTIEADAARSTAIELVASAVRYPANFKQIDQVLTQYEPDPAAAELLIAAFEAGKAPAWLTACLLGRIDWC